MSVTGAAMVFRRARVHARVQVSRYRGSKINSFKNLPQYFH
jgi:hypothetical protein